MEPRLYLGSVLLPAYTWLNIRSFSKLDKPQYSPASSSPQDRDEATLRKRVPSRCRQQEIPFWWKQGFPVNNRLFGSSKESDEFCFGHHPLTAKAYRPERSASSGASVGVDSQDSVFSSCGRLRLGGKQALFAKEHWRSEIYTPQTGGENRCSLRSFAESAERDAHGALRHVSCAPPRCVHSVHLSGVSVVRRPRHAKTPFRSPINLTSFYVFWLKIWGSFFASMENRLVKPLRTLVTERELYARAHWFLRTNSEGGDTHCLKQPQTSNGVVCLGCF